MDFRTQRYFMTVAQELNFTRAAERLNMSQPPLSCTIRDLEEELGVQLFIRGKRRLRLTDAGKHLAVRTAEMLALADKTKDELRSLGGYAPGRLYVACDDGTAASLAASWIARYRETDPAATYDIFRGSTEEAIERLDSGLADLAVIAFPYDTRRFEGIPLAREPWCAFIPSDHPLASGKMTSLTPHALRSERLAIPLKRAAEIRKWLSISGGEPEILCTLTGIEDALAIAQQGAAISLYPGNPRYMKPGTALMTLTGPELYAEYGLVRPKEGAGTPLASSFAAFVAGSAAAS